MPDRALSTPLNDNFERYLQNKGKSRGGDGRNYRRNVARELERFAEWAAGEGDDDWTGVVAGAAVVVVRDRTGPRRYTQYTGRLVGPLLVCVGGLAALSALVRQPATGVGGIAAGLASGELLAYRVSHTTRTAITTRTIAIHRFVEGITPAALALVGPAVTAVGVVVLSAHTVLECVVVAGQRTGVRKRVGAVLLVSGMFAIGAVIGAVGLVGVPVSRLLLSAVAGGALLAFGIAESQSRDTTPVNERMAT